MTRTIGEHVRDARVSFERAGIAPDEAALDADVLARHTLGGWERGRLLAGLRDPAPSGFAAAYAALVQRRTRREPTAYITGAREFWSLDFAVTRDTLIPRPETELILEEILARLCPDREARPAHEAPENHGPDALRRPVGAGVRSPAPVRLADVGTGTGCLAVAAARWLPNAHVVATEVSGAAIAVARRNAASHHVETRVTFVQTDLLTGVTGPFDAILANPPYVPTGDLSTLQPEVGDHEPAGALDGGQDGLDIIRRLIPEAAARLVSGGWLIFEFGFGQVDGVRAALASEPRLVLDAVRDDYSGIPRITVARRT